MGNGRASSTSSGFGAYQKNRGIPHALHRYEKRTSNPPQRRSKAALVSGHQNLRLKIALRAGAEWPRAASRSGSISPPGIETF
jgi:hypothetical protein